MVKKIKAISIFLFTFLLTYGQNTVFLKKYSSTSEISFNYIIVSHDRNYIVAGETFSPNGGNSFLLKTDSAGNELWRKTNNLWTPSDDSSTTSTCILETSDHDLIICGSLVSLQGGYNSQFYISKTDSIGNKLWDLILGGIENEALNKVIEISDGNFIAIGRKSYLGGSDIFIVKFDSNGDTIWTKSYNHFGGIGIEVINYGSKFILVATGADSLTFIQHGIISIIDSTGNEISYTIISDSINLTPVSINNTGLNEIAVLSYNTSSSSIYGTIIILDTLLTEINRQQIVYHFNAVWLNDTSFIAVFPDVVTKKHDKSGQSVWLNYSFEEFALPYHGTIDYNNNVLVCGRVDEGQITTSQGFILKIIDTTLVSNFIPNLEIVDKNIFFHTNPLTTEIFIHIKRGIIDQGDTVILYLYNSYGLECSKQQIKEHIEILNKEKLSTGVYSYQLKSGNEKIYSGKILIFNK